MNLTIAQEALAYKNYLSASVEKDGGIVSVVSNLKELWVQANIGSDRLRILIAYAGESARGPFSLAAATRRVDRQWQAAITRGRGYSADRGDTLTTSQQGTDAFYDKVEIYRDGFRSITTTSVEQPLDYKGCEPLNFGNLIMDGYLLKWSTAHDLPDLQPITNNQEII
jgi:hypothetical protein